MVLKFYALILSRIQHFISHFHSLRNSNRPLYILNLQKHRVDPISEEDVYIYIKIDDNVVTTYNSNWCILNSVHTVMGKNGKHF